MLFSSIWIQLPDRAWLAVAFSAIFGEKTPSDRMRITNLCNIYVRNICSLLACHR